MLEQIDTAFVDSAVLKLSLGPISTRLFLLALCLSRKRDSPSKSFVSKLGVRIHFNLSISASASFSIISSKQQIWENFIECTINEQRTSTIDVKTKFGLDRFDGIRNRLNPFEYNLSFAFGKTRVLVKLNHWDIGHFVCGTISWFKCCCQLNNRRPNVSFKWYDRW